MDSGCYVYGIVPAGTGIDADTSAAGLGDGVELLTVDRVAGVVESVDPDRPFGTRKDLLAHSAVLDGLARTGSVVPLRFGSVMVDRDSVRDDLLTEQQDGFLELLAAVEGCVQYTLRGRYELDVVLAEVVEENGEVADLRERTRAMSADAGHYDRIRLGELVSQAVASKREHDAEKCVDALAPFVRETVAKDVSGMEDVADLALLVENERQADLEDAAESLAATTAGRVRLSLVGPMAPYDFVPAD